MKPVPSKPAVILHTVQPKHEHLLYNHLDGLEGVLTKITEDCGADGDFGCEVEVAGQKYPLGLSALFLEAKDKSGVPETHAHPAASHAWCFCRYRDEAWSRGEWRPKDE